MLNYPRNTDTNEKINKEQSIVSKINKMENLRGDGRSEGGGKGLIRVEDGNRNPWVYLSLGIILMRIGRSLNLNPRFVRAHSMPIYRTRVVPVGKGTTATRRNLSAPSSERAEMSGGESIARQRALVGNSLDDEQWSDDLFNPLSH